MANKSENDKGFLVIETTAQESFSWGGQAICDDCNNISDKGFYVAVLGWWLCPRCYEQWLDRAIVYEEDKSFEKRNYNRFALNLNLELID